MTYFIAAVYIANFSNMDIFTTESLKTPKKDEIYEKSDSMLSTQKFDNNRLSPKPFRQITRDHPFGK